MASKKYDHLLTSNLQRGMWGSPQSCDICGTFHGGEEPKNKMANNRMWLKCACGEFFLIAKKLASWYAPARMRDIPAEYDQWLDDHTFCREDSQEPFTLEYEHKEFDF